MLIVGSVSVLRLRGFGEIGASSLVFISKDLMPF